MGNQEFTRIILDKMQQVLKPHGFRKKGSTFTKKIDDDVVQVVNLQKSRASNRDRVKATLNFGVFSLPLARQLNRRGCWARTLDSPTEADCHWRERIGALMPEHLDRWWEMQNAGEATTVGTEIVEVLMKYGLPALDKVASTDKLQALWESGQSPGLTEKQRVEYLRAVVSDKAGEEPPPPVV